MRVETQPPGAPGRALFCQACGTSERSNGNRVRDADRANEDLP